VPLVQRDDALELCVRACASVDASGTLLLFEGGPGAGKSAMLDAAAAIATAHELQVLRAAGSQFERDFGYGVVRQLFEPRLLRAGGAERDELLGGPVRPAVAALGFGPAAGEQPEHVVDHALVHLVARLAALRPVLLAVDDLALVDAPSLSFLRHLSSRQADHPVVTVASVNSALVGTQPPAGLLSIEQAAIVLALEPLDAAGVGELLAGAGRPAHAEVREELTRRTAGNPFLIANMVERDLDGPIPAAISRDLALRLAPLPPEARRLAQAAAVLGDGASVTVAARTMGVRPAVALDALDALVAAGVLRRSGMIEFSSPLLRSAVYGMLGQGERARLHRRAGRALWLGDAPVTQAAEHLMGFDGAGETWAIEILRGAAREAPDRDAAVTYLRRALSEDPPASVRADLLAELAAAELSGGGPDAARHLAEVVDLLPPGVERAEACEQLARVLWGLGRYGEAGQTFAGGLDDLGGSGGGIAARLGVGCVAAGRVLRDAGAQQQPSPNLAALESTPDEPATAAVLALELLLAGGRRDQVAELAGRALADGRLLRAQTAGGPAYQAVVCALVWADELDAAERAATLGIDDADRLEMRPALGVMLLLRAAARLRGGRLRAALDDARAAARRAPAQLPVPLPSPEALIAEIQLEQGHLAVARESANRALGAATGRVEHALAQSARARVELTGGNAKLALADLSECGSRLREAEIRNPSVAAWRSRAALAALRLGEHDRAAELAAEELELAQAFGAQRALGLALMAGASIAPREERVEGLRAAAAALERSPGMLDHAHALAELGAELRRSGRRRAAREALRRALDLAVRCGADVLARRARQDLLATGARPRRARISGVGSLTPRERQIAELAAHGQSNRAIADQLIVSEKTIEWHLANAYRKLEIRGRGALARSLTDA
jgi:DNA-binding CsgD family transcriptional regulator